MELVNLHNVIRLFNNIFILFYFSNSIWYYIALFFFSFHFLTNYCIVCLPTISSDFKFFIDLK